MKPNPIATRALAGLLPPMALFATPAVAQDAAQPAPPATTPVVVAQPAPPEAAPAQAVSSGPSADDRAKFEASAVAATGTATAEAAQPAANRAAVRPVPRAVTRSTGPARVTAPAAATAAPAAIAPAATAPAPEVTALPEAPLTTPVQEPAVPVAATDTETATTTTTTSGMPVWAWVLGGLAVLALAAAALFARRRRQDEPIYETAHEERFVEPVVAAPLATEVIAENHAEVAEPAADEVAAITAASAPVTGRPWIELSLRPLRAGTTDENAMVDLELTLANAGQVAARDVRVSTFMLGDGSDAPTDMERLLATEHGGTEVNTGDLAAGEGSRVDASLTVPREGLEGATFQPIVVADVRYTLPDGGEGRTSAAFAVGVNDGTDDPTPLRLGGDVREDVSATLHGVPERA